MRCPGGVPSSLCFAGALLIQSTCSDLPSFQGLHELLLIVGQILSLTAFDTLYDKKRRRNNALVMVRHLTRHPVSRRYPDPPLSVHFSWDLMRSKTLYRSPVM